MAANQGSVIAKVLLLLLLLGGGAFVAFVGLRDPVSVVEVWRGIAVDAVPGSVVVYADKYLQELKVEGTGRVVEMARLDPGGQFTQGEVLLKLDTSEIERSMADAKRVHEASRELARIKNERNSDKVFAQQRLDNVRRLHELGNASTEDVNAAQRELDGVLTSLAVAEFNARNEAEDHERVLEMKRILLKKMIVIAPADGMVEGVNVHVGTLVSSGATVATFYSNERVVVARVGEENVAKVKIGDPARVQLLTFPGKDFDARVAKILPFADPETRRYNVHLKVDATSAQLLPNSTGEVIITVGNHDDVLLIPRRAIFNGINGTFVYVVKDGRIERRQIELGYRGLTTTEATQGLTEGEKVIVEDLDRFRDGQRVRIESNP